MPASSHPVLASSGFLHLSHSVDVVKCRQAVRRLMEQLDFSVIEQTMMVTAASEIARNTVTHGGGGQFSWEVAVSGIRTGLRLTFEDTGPGIVDVSLAMTNGWSSASSLGFGLPGAKRLVNEFEINSTPGQGTRVVITRWRKP
jgi:serine/threonine-protein kinase RsbT